MANLEKCRCVPLYLYLYISKQRFVVISVSVEWCIGKSALVHPTVALVLHISTILTFTLPSFTLNPYSIESGTNGNDLAISHCGKRIFAGCSNGDINVYAVSTHALITVIRKGDYNNNKSTSSSSSSSNIGTALQRQRQRQRQKEVIEGRRQCVSSSGSPSAGARIGFGSGLGLRDQQEQGQGQGQEQGQEQREIEPEVEVEVEDIEPSYRLAAVGNRLYAADRFGKVTVYDCDSYERLAVMEGHPGSGALRNLQVSLV